MPDPLDERVEAVCRKAFAGWDGVLVDGHRTGAFSDEDKQYWRALFRAALEPAE